MSLYNSCGLPATPSSYFPKKFVPPNNYSTQQVKCLSDVEFILFVFDSDTAKKTLNVVFPATAHPRTARRIRFAAVTRTENRVFSPFRIACLIRIRAVTDELNETWNYHPERAFSFKVVPLSRRPFHQFLTSLLTSRAQHNWNLCHFGFVSSSDCCCWLFSGIHEYSLTVIYNIRHCF